MDNKYTFNTEPNCYSDVAPRGPLQVKNTVVGILRELGSGGVVKPDAAFREGDFGAVRIAQKDLNGAPFDMVVVAEIINPDSMGEYRGRIIEVIGNPEQSDVKIETVMRQFGLPKNFPDNVIKEIENLPNDPTEESIAEELKKGRRDLRDLLTITIDGEEAKDLDDAISLERIDNTHMRLYVHIADVSNYVRENTNLDEEALRRATSVYLSDRVVPMLPPKLSNGLCSLNPNKPRLTLTAEMVVNSETGATESGEVYESIIVSDRRMSYNECFRILTEPRDGDGIEYGKIIDMLEQMNTLAQALKRMRDRRGAINFEMPETKVLLDDDGRPTEVMAYPINFCHGIIESFMICANEFIAEKFCKMNYPFVYRVHEDPDPIKIARFASVAKYYGAIGNLRGKITPLMIANYMDTISDEEAKPALDTLLLRSMAKARYSSNNLGHFGLASEFYCHFTSPIRRYPDLYIHRIIKTCLHGEDQRKHFAPLVENISAISSDMERNSVEAERASVDVKVCEFMKDKIGDEYEGIITGIIDAGLFVMLESTAEGFVAFRSMRDHFIFDDRRYRAVGARTGQKLSIGQKVRVIVSSVDEDRRHIDFVLAEDASSGPDSTNKTKGPGRRKQKTVARIRRKGRRRH
ncbi:ribonuclease R [Ruminococcaceae bacterium YRB3002]|nr:ribonuclease R [Ruminococcaceae bacterium YRB3002]